MFVRDLNALWGVLQEKRGSFLSTIYVQRGIATLSHCNIETVLTVSVSHVWQTLIIITIFLTYPTNINTLQQIILPIKFRVFRFPWEFSKLFLAVFISWGTSHVKNVFLAEKKNGLQNIIIAKVSSNKSNIPSPLDTAGLLIYLWANKKRISVKVYSTPHAAWDRRGVHPLLKFYVSNMVWSVKLHPRYHLRNGNHWRCNESGHVVSMHLIDQKLFFDDTSTSMVQVSLQ